LNPPKEMSRRLLTSALTISILIRGISLPLSLFAQLKVTYPINRMVIQRDAANKASVQVAGSFSQPLDLIEARAVVRVVGQGTTTGWSTLDANPLNGQFSGSFNVTGGWYKIQVRGLKSGSIVAVDSVERFGVGEVFAIIGHSNAQGSSCIINGENKCPTLGGAADERVNVIAVNQQSATAYRYLTTADTYDLPGLTFSQLLLNSGTSPFAEIPWLWGRMGDELVRRINVPLLLYNAGFGGTTMQYTYWSAYDIPFSHSFVRYDLRMPYVNTRNLMNLYVPSTGIRGILIQHGENDRGNPTDSTYKYYSKVIDKIRTEFNKPALGAIIALSSYVGARFDNVRSAQYQVINRSNYNAFLGPDLDNINSFEDRPDGLHFSPSGQAKAGEYWAAAIQAVMLSLTPYSAELQPLASLSCASNNQLTLSQPAGYQYRWNTGSTARSLTVGTGAYSARLKNAQAKIFFPPGIVVPTTVQPSPPTITTSNGTWNICRTAGLQLTSSYSGLNTWSTGTSSSSLVVTQPGTYTLQAKHPVYSCLSNVVSQTIGLSGVLLNLSMQTAKRVVAINDPTKFNLLVRNSSDCDAGPVTVISRLPPNVSVVSTSSSMTAANGIIRAIIPSLTAGSSINQDYTVRMEAPGYYRATSEITATTNTALNATPNNGTGNGESDEALVDLRTTTYSSAVYESPNPNQVSLPGVRSNQPALNPAKADLSLKIQATRQVAAVDQLIDFTLVVENQGGLAATNVVLRNLLPASLQFVSSNSGMSQSGSVVSGTIGQIATGQTVRVTFTVRVMSPGLATNQAQIQSADQSDPDSTPGNGYTNGEDDQASLLLRTLG
jgi:uncharacterized repeat protein (TIGR01451 family)